MKHLLTILSGLLVALLFARCADDDNLSGGIDGLPERGIVIRLSTGELDTRTQLTSTGDYHHVEEVWAVLYKLKDGADAETATEADFEYKTHEKLDWEPMTEEEYGEGNPQGKEFLLHTDGTVLTNGTYRVLCIGLDDRSGAVYSLTNGNSSSSSLQGFSGKTLAEALAVIRGNKDCTELKPVGSQTSSLSDPGEDPSVDSDEDKISMNGDPATAELFAGWEEFVFEEDNINIVEVVLKRRVAGILCYLTDVPLKVNYDGKEQYVTGIRLCLASPAATSISLCRKEGNPTEIEGFGTLDENGGTIPFESLEGNKVTTLAYYQLPYEEQNYDITNTKETFQEGGETANYLMGVYMLPVKCTVEEILFVQLMVQEDKPTSQNQGYETGLYLPDGRCSLSMGQPGPKFIVKESNSGKKDFDIRPNYIYHIGNKDDDTDEPVSLLGQELLVEAKEWTGETIPVEFPSVPIYNTMRLVYPTNPDDIENTEWVGYGDNYVFDCIGVDNIYKPDGYYWDDNYDKLLFLEVDVSVLKEGWSLHIGAPGEDGQMLRFFDDNEYKTDVSRDGQQKEYIPLLMTSYAENDLNKKRRSVTIILTSDGAGKPVNLTVKQDNALIVSMKYGNDDYGVRGFSRRDWHDGETLPWGYSSSSYIPSLIYNYANYKECWCEGNKLYSEAKKNNYDNKFSGSAIYKCAKGFLTLDANGQRDISGHWYLPARRELHSFLRAYPEEAGSTKYWTSTAYVSGKTYCNYVEDIDTGELYDDEIGSTDNIYKPIDRDKSDYTMRAACMIEAPIYD